MRAGDPGQGTGRSPVGGAGAAGVLRRVDREPIIGCRRKKELAGDGSRVRLSRPTADLRPGSPLAAFIPSFGPGWCTGAWGGFAPGRAARWRRTVTAAPETDQRHWVLTEPVVTQGGQVSLRGFAPLVVVQVLFGIWQHTCGGAKITDVNLRAVCDTLLRRQSASIGGRGNAVRTGPVRHCAHPTPAPTATCGRSPIPPATTPATSALTDAINNATVPVDANPASKTYGDTDRPRAGRCASDFQGTTPPAPAASPVPRTARSSPIPRTRARIPA